jgi:hypothetical protein
MAYAIRALERETVSTIEPVDSRKSFYGKAKVIRSPDGNERLQSYSTIVAEYDHETGKVKVNGWYSTTTARHVNAFLARHGKSQMSKAEMLRNTAPQ